jgi:hypothetical protein
MFSIHKRIISAVKRDYGNDVNLLGGNTSTIYKNMDTLIHASKKAGLEINAEKTKYMFLSRHQNAV